MSFLNCANVSGGTSSLAAFSDLGGSLLSSLSIDEMLGCQQFEEDERRERRLINERADDRDRDVELPRDDHPVRATILMVMCARARDQSLSPVYADAI